MGLTLDALARRLRCAECGGTLLSVKPWRQTDSSGRLGGEGSSFGSATREIATQREIVTQAAAFSFLRQAF